MAYQANIPQGNDQLSKSQGDLLGNFQQLDNAFNLNHNALELAPGTAGKHFFVEMPNQSSSPPVTISNEVGLYCNTDINTEPELFFIKQAGSSAPPPLNDANGYSITGAKYSQLGYTRFASGILIKWGIATAVTPSFSVIFPVDATVPVFQQIFNVQITPYTSTVPTSLSFSVFNLTTTSFTINNSPNNTTFQYFAIGV